MILDEVPELQVYRLPKRKEEMSSLRDVSHT